MLAAPESLDLVHKDMHACMEHLFLVRNQQSFGPLYDDGGRRQALCKGECRTLGAESTCLAGLGNKPKKIRFPTDVVPRVVTSRVDDRRTGLSLALIQRVQPSFFPLSPRVVCQRHRRRGAPSDLLSLRRKDHHHDNALSLVHKAVGDEICRISALRPEHRAVRCRRAAGQKALCVTCNLKHPPAACIRASTDDFCLLFFFFVLAPSATTHGQTGRYSFLSLPTVIFLFSFFPFSVLCIMAEKLRSKAFVRIGTCSANRASACNLQSTRRALPTHNMSLYC